MRAWILSLILICQQVPVWAAGNWAQHDGEIFAPQKALFENFEKTYSLFEKGSCGLLVDTDEANNVVRLFFVQNVFRKDTKCLSQGVLFASLICDSDGDGIESSSGICENFQREMRVAISADGSLSIYLPKQQIVLAKTFYRLK